MGVAHAGWFERVAQRSAAALATMGLTACAYGLPPPTSQWLGARATAALPPSLPPTPAHRGELELATSLRGHSYLGTVGAPVGTRPESGYATLGSAEGVIGYRASRVFEIRALGSLGLGPGSIDAYGADAVAPGWPTRLGIGAVLGFSSDEEPFQLQLAADAGIVALATSAFGHHEVRTCTQSLSSPTEHACTPWLASSVDELSFGLRPRPYVRASAIVGVDVVRDLRLFAQGGMVFSPLPGSRGEEVYVPVLALEASAEWCLDDHTSLFASVAWATNDPFFTHGPSASLGIRSVVPASGPGSVHRAEAERVRWIARR
ncbi:MAG: hypothetical protein J0L92_38635 [Deltaproteobacteria bacterium]|nr:hypothetical protein [Deltaproteobacteria bacterium]